MNYGTDPKLDHFEGSSDSNTLTLSFMDHLRMRLSEEDYVLESIRARRGVLPKYPRQQLYIYTPIKLYADDAPQLRGLDAVFVLKEKYGSG